MKTNELYASVAARVDTLGTKINAAETSRVISELISEIAQRISQGELSELEAVVWFAQMLEKRMEDQ